MITSGEKPVICNLKFTVWIEPSEDKDVEKARAYAKFMLKIRKHDFNLEDITIEEM